MILLLLPLFSSLVAAAASGRVDALPEVCLRQCTNETVVEDCTDNWGRVGTIPSFEGPFPGSVGVKEFDALCGKLRCVDGFCALSAYFGIFGAICRTISCEGDDTKCISGPEDLDYEGKCSILRTPYPQYCDYRWCPPEKPIEKEIVPFVPENPLDWRPPRKCPTKCTQDADCIDPEGRYGVIPRVEGVTPERENHNSACGYASCHLPSGACRLYAWVDAPAENGCGFTKCLNNDQCQNAGPANLLPLRFGYCPELYGPGERDCEYHWCLPTKENEETLVTVQTSVSMTTYSSTTQATDAVTTVTTMAVTTADTTAFMDATASTATTTATLYTTTDAMLTKANNHDVTQTITEVKGDNKNKDAESDDMKEEKKNSKKEKLVKINDGRDKSDSLLRVRTNRDVLMSAMKNETK